jgi:microcystin-dependent protein
MSRWPSRRPPRPADARPADERSTRCGEAKDRSDLEPEESWNMSEPFLAEIRMVGFNFAPRGFASCDGQLLPINQNQALFSLVGTTYGGDGRTTFGLPDLRGRAPVHVGRPTGSDPSIVLGEKGGAEQHALQTTQLPAHGHAITATSNPASTADPADNAIAKQARFGPAIHAEPTDLTPLAGAALGSTGGSAAHDNMQPFGVIHFVIALQGVFPSRS